jgi:predicted nucleotidyltransferase
MEVYSHDTQMLEGIEAILTETLPAELPVRYLGMAESIYEREVVDTRPTTSAELKPYVYALRGCLAAEYVQTCGEVEARLRPLGEHILTDPKQEQVAKFVTAIQSERLPDQPVLDDIKEVIEEKLDVLEATPFEQTQRKEYKTALTEWMLEVRTQTHTR